MKIKQIAITLVASLFLLVGCKKNSPPPAASFTYSGVGVAPASVTFTNTSLNAVSYSWDFGDNGNSIEESPTHVYTKGGVYTVKLTATGQGGSNSITKTVNIQTPTSVKITSVKITGMPSNTSSGGGWDNNSGPDVYYEIANQNGTILYSSPTYYQDVVPGSLPLAFTINPPFQVTNFAAEYQVNLWDYDEGDLPPNPDDFIGGYTFSFSKFADRGYPSTGTLQNSSSQIKIELTLQWQ